MSGRKQEISSGDVASDRPGFGEILRTEREARGLAIEEIAASTFVGPHLIEALEKEELGMFSAPVYAIGLLKRYATCLGIPADELLKSLEAALAGKEPPLVSVSKEIRESSSMSGGIPTWVAAFGVLFLAALLIMAYRYFSVDTPESPAGIPGGTEKISDELVPRGDLTGSDNVNMAGDEKETPGLASTAGRKTGDETLSEPVPEEGGGGQTKASPGMAPREGGEKTKRQNDATSLVLIFVTDSWAEVHDGAGRRLLTRIGRAGQRLGLSGQPPFDIRLGYAPGVRIEYNGTPYTWEQKKGTRVAHFQIGQPE